MKRGSLWLGIGALMTCLAVAGCKERLKTVPDVTGLSQAAASAAIVGAGLAVGSVTEQHSATVASGLVIGQSPVPGTQVSPGSVVDLTVSTGPELVAVPEVVGQTQAAASVAVTGAGLAVGAVSEQHSATVASGLVISQSPPPGTLVSAGSTVDLTVSTGPEMIAVPDVTGQTQAAAAVLITGAGFVVGTVTQDFSGSVAAGSVISQSPAGGALALPGSAVALIVSKGPQTVTVPDVVGQTQKSAEAAITAGELAVGTVAELFSDTVPSGEVIVQRPHGGAQAMAGSAVAMVVSQGPRTVAVPNEVWPIRDTGMSLEMVWVPGGTFTMGGSEDEPGRQDSEGPQHDVTVAGFYMGKHEVTQAQWRALTGRTPSHFTGDDLPVENITWTECYATLVKWNKELGLPTDAFRLPSEAEWEYACRAGAATRWHFGDGPVLLEDFAWFAENGDGQTHPVGTRLPNDFGLFDMVGNVMEWCQDKWHPNYQGAPTNGSAWQEDNEGYRVQRGSAYSLDVPTCRAAYRANADRETGDTHCGFRMVRTRQPWEKFAGKDE